jgi:hypothetical protein
MVVLCKYVMFILQKRLGSFNHCWTEKYCKSKYSKHFLIHILCNLAYCQVQTIFLFKDCCPVQTIFKVQIIAFSIMLPKIFWGAYSRRVVRQSVPNLCQAHNFVIWSRILKLFHRKDRYLEGQVHSMTLIAAKSCPTNNFFVWSRILKLFHRNDHHIKMTCRAEHLGRYLEGEGHSMTLQQNRVRPITLLFKSDLATISQKWSPYWDDVSGATFGSLP